MLFMLSLVPILKQWFNKHINGKNQTNRDQKSNLLFLQWHNWYWRIWFKLTKGRQKIGQGHRYLLDIDIYYIGYITIHYKIANFENVYSENPLYLIIDQLDGHIEETNGNKYLVFGSTNEYKKVFKKYTEFWDGIKDEIETINGGKKGEYGIGFMKIKSIHMIICHYNNC